MLAEQLDDPSLWVGLAAVGLFFLVMWRFRRRPTRAPLDRDVCYDYVSEPASAPNPELKAAFADLLADREPAELAEAQLIRLAVMNRGGLRVDADQHLRPFTVTFAPGARLVAAELAEPFGPAPEALPALTRGERSLEVAPFDLPVDCALVFNMIVVGARAPQAVDGGIAGQPAFARLK